MSVDEDGIVTMVMPGGVGDCCLGSFLGADVPMYVVLGVWDGDRIWVKRRSVWSVSGRSEDVSTNRRWSMWYVGSGSAGWEREMLEMMIDAGEVWFGWMGIRNNL